MKRLLYVLAFAAAFFALHGQARASCGASWPYTLTNGTTADASQVMANYNYVRGCATNVDNTQIGASGIFASQIIPTTIAQATFGGSQPYTFTTGITSIGTGYLQLSSATSYDQLIGNNSSYGVILGNQSAGPAVRFDANGAPGVAWIGQDGHLYFGSTSTTYGSTGFVIQSSSGGGSQMGAFSTADAGGVSVPMWFTRGSGQLNGIDFRGVVSYDEGIFQEPGDDSLYFGYWAGSGSWNQEIRIQNSGTTFTTPAIFSGTLTATSIVNFNYINLTDSFYPRIQPTNSALPLYLGCAGTSDPCISFYDNNSAASVVSTMSHLGAWNVAGLNDSALGASAPVVCTDGSKNLTTNGCSGGVTIYNSSGSVLSRTMTVIHTVQFSCAAGVSGTCSTGTVSWSPAFTNSGSYNIDGCTYVAGTDQVSMSLVPISASSASAKMRGDQSNTLTLNCDLKGY